MKKKFKKSCLDFSSQDFEWQFSFFNLDTYNIQSVNGAVGKFCLSKYYYRLGEDVLGTFDFSEGPLSCIKVSLSVILSLISHSF